MTDTTATAEGAVYELVARGNKDAYFYQDLPDSKYLFDSSYEAQAAFSYEMRRIPPRTAAEFGRTVEFELDLVGDVMRDPTILIQLPSWLPPQQAAIASKSIIQDASGVTYGYTTGIAYWLFESIQFYQDNILLQDFTSESLWAFSRAEGTYAHTFVSADLTGDTVPLAAPGLLRLNLPLIGCQSPTDPGFPQRACTKHVFRLRCKLRRLEDLVEASNGAAKPTPWDRTLYIKSSASGSFTPFQSLKRTEIGFPLLQLETLQVYVDREIQDKLLTMPMKLPFRRTFSNVFSQNKKDYLSVLGGGSSPLTRRIDGRHPTSRILWFFRSQKDTDANKLWKISTPENNPYYTTTSLIVAGQARELPRGPMVWRDLTNHAKEDIDTGIELSSMNWTLGAIAPLRFPIAASNAQPTGSINMTTADRPTFYIDAANPGNQPPITQLFVFTEGWAVFTTDGRGYADLFSQN